MVVSIAASAAAWRWLKRFLKRRLFLFHSLLSPLLNAGRFRMPLVIAEMRELGVLQICLRSGYEITKALDQVLVLFAGQHGRFHRHLWGLALHSLNGVDAFRGIWNLLGNCD